MKSQAQETLRDTIYREIMRLYPLYLRKFPQTKFVEILWARYNVPEVRLMTIEQLQNLMRFMTETLSTSEAS